MYALAKGGGAVGSDGLSMPLLHPGSVVKDHQYNLQDNFIN